MFGVKFKGHRCFSSEWAGFEEIKPINIIIGKNNHGKSCLIDLIDHLANEEMFTNKSQIEYQFFEVLYENELKRIFRQDVESGILSGNHWNDHGRYFVNQEVTWQRNNKVGIVDLRFREGFEYKSKYGDRSTEERLKSIKALLLSKTHWLRSYRFHRVLADRDIVPEHESTTIFLSNNGAGATNIIRRFITSSSSNFNRDLIQKDLLAALNTIFGEDASFNEINVRVHDEENSENKLWEIYLGEKTKGLIKLSESGSGLKTVILVLLNILLFPFLEKKSGTQFVFAFEEIENNLHPALFKRLLIYIENISKEKGFVFFLSTHSSIVLDFFGSSNNAQIIHVRHNGDFASTQTITSYFDQLKVLVDLGNKTSDLLMANCIVWVEGPSDRIYFNKWIEIYSNNELSEGRHYQCAYYGGSLLAHDQFLPPDEAELNSANLFMINSKNILIADGDRTSAKGKGAVLKPRISKIKSQLESTPDNYIWITDAKEIENYIPATAIGNLMNIDALPEIGKYEKFFSNVRGNSLKQGYFQKHFKKNCVDKVDLALRIVPFLNEELL